MTARRADDLSRTPLSDAELLSAITEDLRSIYSDIIRRPLPDELAAALRRLEAATQREKASAQRGSGGCMSAPPLAASIERAAPRPELARRAS